MSENQYKLVAGAGQAPATKPKPGQTDSFPLVVDALRRNGRVVKPCKAGTQYRCQCPAHDDRRPSLVVSRGDDGRALIYCHKGCQAPAILKAMGLEMNDLFPRPLGMVNTVRRNARSKQHFPTLAEAVKNTGRLMGSQETLGTWIYFHDDDEPAFAVARFTMPDGSKDYRAFKPVPTGWTARIPKGRRPLFNLAKVKAARQVVVVEGEKCVDWCSNVGILATTASFGAKSVGRTDWKPLAGKDVIVVPDNDTAGDIYVDDVLGILAKLRPKPRVTVLRLPGLDVGGDVANWIDGQPEEWEPHLIAAEFQRLAAAAAEAQTRPQLRILAMANPAADEHVKPVAKVQAAADWLRSRLAAGAVPTTDLMAEGRAAGFPPKTLNRAKALAGVESVKSSSPRGPWSWGLVTNPTADRPPQSNLLSIHPCFTHP